MGLKIAPRIELYQNLQDQQDIPLLRRFDNYTPLNAPRAQALM